MVWSQFEEDVPLATRGVQVPIVFQGVNIGPLRIQALTIK